MSIRKWIAGLVLALTIVLPFSCYALADETELSETEVEIGYINATYVRLRSEGNLNADVLTIMSYGAKLIILNKEGEWYKVIHNDYTGYVFNDFVTIGESGQAEMNGNAEMLDWLNNGPDVMKTGTVVTITDVSTGIQFKGRVLYGTKHADVEPLTADDTAKKRQTRGGSWSWTRRAIWVTLEDGRTFAASANGVPHGGSTINNNGFPGHFCVHFLNSRIHGTNRVDQEHQKQIKIAYGSLSRNQNGA